MPEGTVDDDSDTEGGMPEDQDDCSAAADILRSKLEELGNA